jgi:hypothetical protein
MEEEEEEEEDGWIEHRALTIRYTHPSSMHVFHCISNRDAKLGFTFASLGLHPVRVSFIKYFCSFIGSI